MKSKLIDINTDLEIHPKYNNDLITTPINKNNLSTITRREFLLYSLLSSSSVIILNNKAEANPLFVIGALIAGSVIRGIARVIGKTVSQKVVGLGAIAYASLPKKVQSAVVEEVVADLSEAGIKHASKFVVHEIASDHSKALWAKTDYKNPLVLNIKNHTGEYIETPIKLALKEKKIYKPEVTKGMILRIAPYDKVEFNIKTFINLPSFGARYVATGIPVTVNKKITIKRSEIITIMRTKYIYS